MSWSEVLLSVLTSVQLAIYRVADELEVEAVRQLRAVEVAVDRLRGAMAKSSKQRDDETIARLARDAHVKTFALAQMVHNTQAKTAVSRLADLLTSYVSTPLLAA